MAVLKVYNGSSWVSGQWKTRLASSWGGVPNIWDGSSWVSFGGGQVVTVTVANGGGGQYGYSSLGFFGSISPSPFTIGSSDLISAISNNTSGSEEFSVTFDGSPSSTLFTSVAVQDSSGSIRNLTAASASTSLAGGLRVWTWSIPFNDMWTAAADRTMTFT